MNIGSVFGKSGYSFVYMLITCAGNQNVANKSIITATILVILFFRRVCDSLDMAEPTDRPFYNKYNNINPEPNTVKLVLRGYIWNFIWRDKKKVTILYRWPHGKVWLYLKCIILFADKKNYINVVYSGT
jgi:hypothetical protein